MSFFDYLWIVRLVIEILKIIAAMDEPERLEIANLRAIMPDFAKAPGEENKTKKTA